VYQRKKKALKNTAALAKFQKFVRSVGVL
jgi:hypothetical protein